VKDDTTKAGHITLIRGIHNYAEGLGSLDAEEIKEKVLSANGTVIEFDSQNIMKITGWLNVLDNIVVPVDDIPAELIRLTEKINNIRDAVLKSRIDGYRLRLAKEYVRYKIANTEIRVIVFKYLEDEENTFVKRLILEGKYADRMINELLEISMLTTESLAQTAVRAADGRLDEQQLNWSYDDVIQFTDAMRKASSFYRKEEISKLNGPDYWTDEAEWIKNRKRQDKRWLSYDAGNPEHRKNAEQILEYIQLILEPQLGVFLQEVIQTAEINEEDIISVAMRTKKQKSLLNKVARFRKTDWGANATIADAVDLLGGEIVVSDFAILEKIMQAVESEITQRGGVILRKENKFIANDPLVIKEARPDAYRAIQYIVQFWGEDGLQHTFELQLKTFSSKISQDLNHNSVYKPEVLNIPGELQKAVTSYTWKSLYQETAEYLHSKNVRVGPRTIGRSKRQQIIRAIRERNYNMFYDLALSDIDADTIIDAKTAQFIQDFFAEELQKLEVLKELNMETLLALARAAHDAYYEEAIKGNVENPQSDQFGWKLSNQAEEFLEQNLPEGWKMYDQRFENYRGQNGDNKISAQDLRLHELSDEQLIEFLKLAGKDTDTPNTKIQSLIEHIRELRTGISTNAKPKIIMNLYHTDFDSQRRMGFEYIDTTKNPIQSDKARKEWNDKLFVNQLGAVATAAILTEFGGIDSNGALRDLSRIVLTDAEGQQFTKREMLTFMFFICAINPGSNFRNKSYRDFITSDDSAWAKNIDKLMDRAILSELVKNQLITVRERIKNETNPVLIARLQKFRAELIEKYIHIMVANTNVSALLCEYIQEKTRQDIEELLLAQEGFEDLRDQIVASAKTEDTTTLRGLFYSGARMKEIVVLINDLTNEDEGNVDLLTLNRLIAEMQQYGTQLFTPGYVFNEASADMQMDEFIENRRRNDARFTENSQDAVLGIIAEIRTQHAPKLAEELNQIVELGRENGADIVMTRQRVKSSIRVIYQERDVAETLDLLGGRIVVKDLHSLEIFMQVVERFYSGRLLSKENNLLNQPAIESPEAVIRYIIHIDSNHCFELELKTEQAIIISDLAQSQTVKTRQLGWNSFAIEMNRYLTMIRQARESAEQLEVPQDIKAEMKNNGAVVILGAPGSGKTEQLNIALSDMARHSVDIRELFFEHIKETFDGDWDKFSNAYKSDPLLKSREADWISETTEFLYGELMKKTKDGAVILLDEFDLAIEETLNNDELKTAKVIVDLASRLIKNGRKVVLIIHPQGARTPEFFAYLKEKNISNIVETKYLSQEQEKAILNVLLMEEEKIDDFLAQIQGLPTAYLGFMAHIGERQAGVYRRSYNQLIEETKDRIGKVYQVAKLTGNMRIVNLLFELAQRNINLDAEDVRNEEKKLLETGLVGKLNGVLVMPQIVKETILDEENPIFINKDKFEQINDRHRGKIAVIRGGDTGDIIFADAADVAYPELLGILSIGRLGVILDSHPDYPMFALSENVVNDNARLESYETRPIPGNPTADYLIFDHHYEGQLADGTSFLDTTTTLFVVKYINFLLQDGRVAEVERLKTSIIFANHCDADIVLAGFALRFLAEYKRVLTKDDFAKLMELLQGASIYNDHLMFPKGFTLNEAAKNLIYLISYFESRKTKYSEIINVVKIYIDSYLNDVAFEDMGDVIRQAIEYKKYEIEEDIDKLHTAFEKGKQSSADISGMWFDNKSGVLIVDIDENIAAPTIIEYINTNKFAMLLQRPIQDIKMIVTMVPVEGQKKRVKLRVMPSETKNLNLYSLYAAMNTRFADSLGQEEFAGRENAGGGPRLGMIVDIEDIVEVIREQISKQQAGEFFNEEAVIMQIKTENGGQIIYRSI
ncbi:MAG: hypothetical protein ABH952_09740, partial [Candidatus Omnitrophota bacterium]